MNLTKIEKRKNEVGKNKPVPLLKFIIKYGASAILYDEGKKDAHTDSSTSFQLVHWLREIEKTGINFGHVRHY